MTKLLVSLLELAVAIGVPALIARFAPRRWRVWAVGLWALAPLLVLLSLGVSEMVSGKSSAADLGKLIYGLELIGSILALPWLIACGAGFALGAMLRGRGAREADAFAPPPAGHPVAPSAASGPPVAASTLAGPPPPIETDTATLSPPGGWRAVHVGFADDGLVIDGLAVWSLTWRPERGPQVMLAHPAHPAEQHEFSVYSIDDGARAARFAAAELSNGVWGFYVWVVAADAVSGVSADGSLRYEHDLGPYEGGRYDATAPVARLYAVRSGAQLFDGVAWPSSRIVPQADGGLLLSLEHGGLQTLFRIDPAAGTFRDLATTDGPRPLAELADAAAAARAACDDRANAYLGRRVAPDGALVVELQSAEWSNSHWVRSPRVVEVATGRVLLDFWGTDWDAAPSFPRSRTARLSLRRYHFGGGAEVELDLAAGRYRLLEASGDTAGPLDGLAEALEAASRRSAATAPPRPSVAAPRTKARSWSVALLILVGAVALIAAATVVTTQLQGKPPPQKLDTIPPMPGPPQAR